MPDTPKHVAVVVPSLARAGAERVAETLAREFVRSVRVTIVTMEPRLSMRELADMSELPWADRVPPGCQHRHLSSSGSGVSRILPLVLRFASLSRRERFDAVYSFLTWTNVLVASARLLGGRYVHVASEHALAASLRSHGGQLRTIARTLPVVYRRPDSIVLVSDAVRDSMRASGLLPRPERAVTIPNPVDGQGIRRLAAEPAQISLPTPEGVVLVCVARLHEQKDHLTLLRALARLPARYSLVIVGDGPLRSELREWADRLGVQDRVLFTGVITNPYPVMRRADVIVLPSREEGFGLVAAEAAALGIPFLGSDVGGLRELAGLLGQGSFPPGDHEALARAILDVSSQNKNAKVAADVVDSLFDPGKIAARYLSLASGVPEERGQPGPR